MAYSDFDFALLADWRTALLYLALAVTTGLLGFMLGVFPGILIVGPLLHLRGIQNGAPFQEGDIIQIIGGPHDGLRTHIYSKWQGESVRVKIGEKEKENFEDVMNFTQIIKIKSEQSGAANPLQPSASGDC